MDKKINGYVVEDRTLKGLMEGVEQYSEPVRKIIWDELFLKFEGMDCELMDIKSPIEQALFLAVDKIRCNYIEYLYKVMATSLIKQSKVEVKGKTYYVDFELSIGLSDQDEIKIAIECDGHDFHEKTKEQAKKDRQRERNLIAAGYTVVRFTGSEIYQDPYQCADEVLEIVRNKIRKN